MANLLYYSPLERACYNGNKDDAISLIKETAGQLVYTQRLAFLHATTKGMFEVVQELKEFSPEKDIRFAFVKACSNGHAKIVKSLLDAGTNVNIKKGLWAACSIGHLEIAVVLIDAAANANKTDRFEKEPLWAACSNGHVKIAKRLIDAGADVNTTDWFGREPLWAACSNGHVKIAKLLIDAGTDVNRTDWAGRNPFAEACLNGHVQIAKLLMDAGANINKADKYGKEPFWEASSDGRLEIVKLFIDAGADVNKADRAGRGVLWTACSNGHAEIAKLLIDAGADANKTDVIGRGPLWEACCNCHKQTVKLLIDSGANVNKADNFGRSLLWKACSKRHVGIAKLIIDAGADVNVTNWDERDLLSEACCNGHADIAKHLIDAGADVKGRKELLWTARVRGHVEIIKLLIHAEANIIKLLWAACRYGYVEIAKVLIDAVSNVNESELLRKACAGGSARIVKTLIDAGVDVNKTNRAGKGLLLAACSSIKVVKILINAGACVNKTDRFRRGPLWEACSTGRVKTAKLLIDAGADVNKTDMDGREPLWEACSENQVEIAKLLIDAGADVNKADMDGREPLREACSENHVEIAKLLIDAGADVNKADMYDERGPLWRTCYFGHTKMAKLLIDAGADIKAVDKKNNSVLHAFLKFRKKFSVEQLDFLNFLLSKDLSLVGRCAESKLLPHEYPYPTEIRKFLHESWVKYRYHELYSRGTTKPKQIKICVIGDAGAGKTTLIKTLRNIDWEKGGDDRRTASMDVSKAAIESAGEVVFCDFAGQPYFHKTHGLFFSYSTTAFLLVADLTKSNSELQDSSFYFCSFVKCSVGLTELKQAFVIVIGSRKDKLRNLENGEMKLRQLVVALRQTYGRWFNFYAKCFVMNCRERRSETLHLLKKAIGEVKTLVIEISKDVPIIVEEAVTSFLPTLRDPLHKFGFFERIYAFFAESEAAKKTREKTLFSLIRNSLIPQSEEDSCYKIRVMDASVFQQLLVESVWPGLSDQVQGLLVEFLQGIGEIFAIEDKIILEPPWLCQNAIGPLLSPAESPEFPISLQCFSPGTATKEKIHCALKAFNDEEWENIDETISLLCHLEICYPLPDKSDTYRFPALLIQKRPFEVWRDNSEMKIYVGRRLRKAEETDIITPGTMPFLQCHVHNAACFRGLKPVIWHGGLMIYKTIDGRLVEGMIMLQQKDKALDFVVRGPEHSERECLKLLTDLKQTGEKILLQKSPGTNTSYMYISCVELKQLKDFPLAYAEQDVEEKIKTSTKSNVFVSEGTTRDSLKNLFALHDNHVDYLSYNNRCAILLCLEKDKAGMEILKEHLQGLTQADRVKCQTAAMLISTWSENLCATAESLANAARQLRLLYLLALLNEDGAIELSTEEKAKAEKDLNFIRTSSPSLLKKRFVETAATVACEGEDATPSFGDEFLDAPLAPQERFRAAQRIQPKWRSIGRILGPETFEDFEIYAFGEKRSDNDGALHMLDAWANRFGTRATRRHFLNAVKDPDVGYSNIVAAIFPGPH